MKKTNLEELREKLNILVDKRDINLHEGEILILSQKLNLLEKSSEKIYI
jgi:hypothetical protein